jgi:hypothetical protein
MKLIARGWDEAIMVVPHRYFGNGFKRSIPTTTIDARSPVSSGLDSSHNGLEWQNEMGPSYFSMSWIVRLHAPAARSNACRAVAMTGNPTPSRCRWGA